MAQAFSPISRFSGRNMVIASSHGKEVVLAPLLCDLLKVTPMIDSDFSSDRLRENTKSMQETPLRLMRRKLLGALAISGESLGIGTEAFFVAHPKYPWVVVHTETAMLIDRNHRTEAVYTIISLQTNYQVTSVSTIQELLGFAEQIGFPSHGLRFVSDHTFSQPITDLGALVQYGFQHGLPNQMLHVESDIRVKYNPTRRKIVKLCVQQLLKSVITTTKQYVSGQGFVCRCGKFKNLVKVDGSDLFCLGCQSIN